jgi:flagellar protein FlgJ
MSTQGYVPRPAGQESIFDMGRLAQLKHQTQGGPEANKQVARQFEALFLQMMVKRMRAAAIPKEGLFHSQQSEMIQGMADEQMALQLSDPGIGLARSMLAQMQQGQARAAETAQAGFQNIPRAAGGAAFVAAAERRPSQPGRDLASLLEVLRNNRARDQAMEIADDAPNQASGFISRVSGAASRASQASGVPANLIMGQAALESGWGQREIQHPDGRPSHNLFGIKAGPDWKGDVVNVTTTEYLNGQPQKMVQPFRAYKSYDEAFADYAKLIGGSPRYERVTQASNEIEAARRIQQAGYATDPGMPTSSSR